MYRHFSECLEHVLTVKGWRSKRLALEINVNKSTVSRWLNGETEPRNLAELVSIAEALDVTTDELLGHHNELTPHLELIRKLPKDLRDQELKRLQKLVENYRKT
ncbi:helix-turn-helix domain-containing protein [Endozoicomonas euniceicola]|uniref:Helix-turn-helix domain-containing protein n=1 Tax=Endozoicomonas euniceicola TaxID=1234143 RepID=A0ABY6GND6_9GAMM|nr:helix-turn-helix transcriptional regulator [Endozoicomonas euniceicola]UYM14242.1 helix-turn-helix domain-containing protein [Endozoicomonas euniceicola]